MNTIKNTHKQNKQINHKNIKKKIENKTNPNT